MSNKDGGPAFPHPAGWRRDPHISDGMTLRDYFAAHANEKDIACHETDPRTGRLFTREVAKYRYASAMLKVRGQE